MTYSAAEGVVWSTTEVVAVFIVSLTVTSVDSSRLNICVQVKKKKRTMVGVHVWLQVH